MTDAEEISPKQSTFIAALLTGNTIEQAATAADISPSTAHRWMREPAFAAELAAARREAIASALDILTAGARSAADEVLALMRDTKVSPMVRLRAAETVLDRLTQWVELADLDARLKALEARREA